MKKVFLYGKLFRVKHYIKNVLILVPLLFSGQFFDYKKLCYGVVGCISFCLMASAVYIFNDLRDLEKDKVHPRKCNRPIAEGSISKKDAVISMIICVVASLVVILFGMKTVSYILYPILYWMLNILYSLGLKNVPLVDILILVSGFLLRVLYGAQITDIEVSGWLYLTVVAISFYMGLGKRRNEIRNQNKIDETRPVLQHYTYEFLDKNMYLCLGLTNTFYALWAMSNEDKILLWTVPLVLIITMKYGLNVEQKYSEGDPVEVIWGDKIIWCLGIIYLAIVVGVLYFI